MLILLYSNVCLNISVDIYFSNQWQFLHSDKMYVSCCRFFIIKELDNWILPFGPDQRPWARILQYFGWSILQASSSVWLEVFCFSYRKLEKSWQIKSTETFASVQTGSVYFSNVSTQTELNSISIPLILHMNEWIPAEM